MSPGQATEPETIGRPSDVYSLGVVLNHMLRGEPPFPHADVVRLLESVILDEPPPLRRFVPDVHPVLQTIVSMAMMKETAGRYESAEAFADDLDRYLAGERILARRAAIGGAGGERFVLRTAREFVGQVRYDEARALLARVLRLPLDPLTCAEARYWNGRALEGIFDHKSAMTEFHAALASPDLPAELRSECAEHEAFCASLARFSSLPPELDGLRLTDLNRDGRRDFARTSKMLPWIRPGLAPYSVDPPQPPGR